MVWGKRSRGMLKSVFEIGVTDAGVVTCPSSGGREPGVSTCSALILALTMLFTWPRPHEFPSAGGAGCSVTASDSSMHVRVYLLLLSVGS